MLLKTEQQEQLTNFIPTLVLKQNSKQSKDACARVLGTQLVILVRAFSH